MRTDDATRQWLLALGLSLGPAVSNGIARFAYGLILPAMQVDLHWTYTQAGWLNTANALGYLAGAIMTLALIDRLGARRLFMVGMLLCPLALAGSAMVIDFGAQTLFRVLAGLAGASVFISGGVMVSALFPARPHANALAISLYFGGGGLGMVASGMTVPLLLDATGPSGWPHAWLVLALACTIALPAAVAAALAIKAPGRRFTAYAAPLPHRQMIWQMGGYLLFSVGYIVYLTFVAALMGEAGAGASSVATAWALLGLAAMAAPFLWRGAIARSAGGGALAASCLATGVATLAPLLMPGSEATVIASAALFGLAFFMAPAAVTSFVRKNLPEETRGRAIAQFTVLFASGQMLGPTLAGVLADATGALSLGMAVSGAILLAAAATALWQKPLGTNDER